MPAALERLRRRSQCRGRLRRRAGARESEDGFVLLETMVAITIITIIMTALTALFITVMGSTSHQRSAQAGAQVADSALDKVHGVGAAGAVKNRDLATVTLQFGGAPAELKTSWLSAMTPATDPGAAPSAGYSATLPTTGVAQTVTGKAFTVNYYVGWCNRQADGSCTTAVGAIPYTRVVVVVTWKDHTCGASGCRYVTATLLNGSADPVFLFNQAPPSSPKITTIPNQTSAVNDVVNGPTAVTLTGVPPFVFLAPNPTALAPLSGLPPGLAMNQAGLITGTPTTQGTFKVTVTVTDAFQNTDTTTFTWTILPPLLFTNPGPQASVVNTSVTLPFTARGGTGTGYTWSATGLPSGLSMSPGGTISGTPASTSPPGSPYTVKVTVKDSSGTRSYFDSFTWTVAYPPLAASNPGAQASTLDRSITTVNLAANGGSGNYTWFDPRNTLPPGVGVSTTGAITGTPTATGTYPVVLTVTDSSGALTSNNPTTVSFTWTVNRPPTVTTPGSQSGEVGVSPAALGITVSSGTSPYTWTASGLSTGVTMNSAGQLVGTPSAAGTSSTKVIVTDKYGATASTGSFAWTVIAAPVINLPDRTTAYKTAVGLDLKTLTSGGAGSYTYSVSNLPVGLSATAGGLITGTTANSGSQRTVTVVVTDSAGGTTSAAFTWWVSNLALSIPDQVTAPGGSINYTAPTASGGAGGKTYSASGLPSWLSFTPANRKFTGTAPATATKITGIAVTVTDSSGSFTDTFNWYVTTLSVHFPGTYSTGKNIVVNLDLTTMTTGGNSPYTTYTVSAVPSGLTFDGDHTISGTTKNSSSNTGVVVTVTDSSGAQASDSFFWHVS